MNIIIFDHVDLDASGCEVVARSFFDNVTVKYCDYSISDINIDRQISQFLDNDVDKYDKVYITDIRVSNTNAERINKINADGKFVLIDHHLAALELTGYKWCHVRIGDLVGLCCGTSLFYEYLTICEGRQLSPTIKEPLERFIEMVRRYDTYEWKKVYNEDTPNKWNAIFGLLGMTDFVSKIMNQLELGMFEFDDFDKLYIAKLWPKKEKEFKRKLSQVIEYTIAGHKAGVVYAENHISELGNYLAEKLPHLDFIAIINGPLISYRGIRPDLVNLAEIANIYGGNGHRESSGSAITKEQQLEYIKILFDRKGDN